MKIKCSWCEKILKEQGGLLFSPPTLEGVVIKIHLCKKCWEKLIKIKKDK